MELAGVGQVIKPKRKLAKSGEWRPVNTYKS